jgi:YD repeat-containing protein
MIVRGGGPGRSRLARWLALLVIAGGLEAPPASVASAADAAPAPEPVRAVPLTAADRVPVPVGAPLDGITDPKVAPPALPGPAADPLAALAGAVPVPEAGGPQQDAFSPGSGVGDHFALLSPEVFNVQDAQGRWVDAALVPDDYGWSLSTPAFTVRFPKELGPDSPIVYETAGGRISTAPAGVAGVAGSASGTTVIYAGALPGTDLRYEVTPRGFKEHVVLRKGASGSLAWDVRAEALALSTDASGGLGLSAGGAQVGRVPPAQVADAASPPRTLGLAYGLSDLGGGSYRISVSVPASYLSKATYPVTVDPGYETTVDPQADTYAYSGAASRNYGADATMQTGPSSKYLGFIRFPTSWQRPGRLIYSAQLGLKNVSEGNDGASLTARRITAGWTEGGLTWSNKPATSDTPSPRTANAPAGKWFTFELKALYQRVNDGEFPDYGVRLESPDKKVFNAKEASCTPSCDPYLLISYDDPPATPNLNTPVDGKAFEDTSGVSLRLDRIPADPNGDEVLVRYQVTPVQGDWSAGWSSAWTDDPAFEVPADWLVDGGTYYWRVQAADVCAQPDTLCDMTDGTGNTRPYPASPVRSFTILKRNWGLDARYATWSRTLGNGMQLTVNEANGNLVLQVPLEAIRTPLGWLRIGLSYNSQAAAADAAAGRDRGLGPGWRLWAGPGSSGQRMPVRIEELSPAPYAGVKVHLRGGGAELYPWRGGGAYAAVGSGSGVVRKAADGTFTYRTADGDLYTFDAQGELLRAKPVTSKPKVAGQAASYRYAFDGAGHLTSLTDPLGRQITFTWSGTPTRLTAVDVLGHQVLLTHAAAGPTHITTPAGETIRLFYGDTCHDVALLSEIRDGEQSARGRPGWRIEHFYDTQPAKAEWHICRARKLFPPQPEGGTERWIFSYGSSGYKGYTSLTTQITDPRGVATATADDFTTTVEFNTSGLPIRIVAPKVDPATEDDWITTMVWDAEGNLLCTRSPQANALDQTQCMGADQRDQLNTEYGYDTSLRPFRLSSQTDPAPAAGEVRLQRTYAYDDGPNFTGLWAELYENRVLSGVPEDERRFTDLAQDWGSGHPAGISVDDSFSIRLSGYLVVPGNQARTYRFRVDSDDGVTLVVGDRVLLDCFGQSFSGRNCGARRPGEPQPALGPGDRGLAGDPRGEPRAEPRPAHAGAQRPGHRLGQPGA